ncbi:MAG: ribosome recycling factor [Parcubacteria group bacterium CG23_combo_of_CG06-09_8_20_14_all_35_6]|nr:MAG: ribosome recycling factor [Parcubacteria group bacterium CG23_combo_of_CG06-09_8_20_14_all_35_6]PIR58301.1 MAG: ribosome recycling factor [Parcubacteria group bacterium CG10_big_fil_rev_8_21_14_0_10_35_15]
MTTQEILKRITLDLDQIIAYLEGEVGKMRTGRADPSLVLDLKVNCFGQEFTIKQLAIVSTSGAREIVIQPWDVSYIEAILAALGTSSLGSSMLAEKNLIRVSLPFLTEESRKNFLKMLSEKMEEQRVAIRKARDKTWKEIQEHEREGMIREDDKFRAKDELDKLVKKYNERIEELGERKKKEVMA